MQVNMQAEKLIDSCTSIPMNLLPFYTLTMIHIIIIINIIISIKISLQRLFIYFYFVCLILPSFPFYYSNSIVLVNKFKLLIISNNTNSFSLNLLFWYSIPIITWTISFFFFVDCRRSVCSQKLSKVLYPWTAQLIIERVP